MKFTGFPFLIMLLSAVGARGQNRIAAAGALAPPELTRRIGALSLHPDWSLERARILDAAPPEALQWAGEQAASRLRDPKTAFNRNQLAAAIDRRFPLAEQGDKLRLRMLLLQLMMGDIAGALGEYARLKDRQMTRYSRETVEKLDAVRRAKEEILDAMGHKQPPRAYAGKDPSTAARAQDKSAKYTQWVQLNTQLMNELQQSERELMDALSEAQRQMEAFWEDYGGFRDEEARTNRKIMSSFR